MDISEESTKVFLGLSDEARDQLAAINDRIQSHEGSWGKVQGGEKNEDGVIEMPFWTSDPIVSDFVTFMYANDLVMNFNWSAWDEGREWYKKDDDSKYETLDIPTALKLLTAVIRNDRFSDGALVGAFESGAFPKIINRLVELGRK